MTLTELNVMCAHVGCKCIIVKLRVERNVSLRQKLNVDPMGLFFVPHI